MASLTLMSYDDHHQHHHITLTLYHFFIFDYDNDISSDCVASNPYMTQLLLLGKFEYTGGPIFKVVLEC